MANKVKLVERLIISFATFAVIGIVLIFYSVLPRPTAANCIVRSGLVSKVIAGEGEGDIVIEMRNDKSYYYINRGIDRGVSVNQLEGKLVNKNIELTTIKHFSIFDPVGRTKHIAKITVDGSVVYSEM